MTQTLSSKFRFSTDRPQPVIPSSKPVENSIQHGENFPKPVEKMWNTGAVHFNEYELQRFHQIKVFSKSIVLPIKILINDRCKPSGTGRSIAFATGTDPIQGGITDRPSPVVMNLLKS
jgi:hypothetical protein